MKYFEPTGGFVLWAGKGRYFGWIRQEWELCRNNFELDGIYAYIHM